MQDGKLLLVALALIRKLNSAALLDTTGVQTRHSGLQLDSRPKMIWTVYRMMERDESIFGRFRF